MIGRISGKILDVTDKYIIIDVSGIGYKLYVIDALIQQSKGSSDEISLWTHMAVRENALDLFGFETKDELTFFELLIGISGIGPRNALGVLSVAPIETLQKAISAGDSSYLTKVSGIGKKTAEKIVLELKDKKIFETMVGGQNLGDESDVIDALVALGYTIPEARNALNNIPEGVTSINEKIKEALKSLN